MPQVSYILGGVLLYTQEDVDGIVRTRTQSLCAKLADALACNEQQASRLADLEEKLQAEAWHAEAGHTAAAELVEDVERLRKELSEWQAAFESLAMQIEALTQDDERLRAELRSYKENPAIRNSRLKAAGSMESRKGA